MVNNNQKLDPNKYNFTEKETRVLLEDISSDFKVFGEDLQSVNRKLDEHTVKLDEHTNKLDEHTGKFVKLEDDLSGIKIDVNEIKKELEDIKSKLEDGVITRQEFEQIKTRVVQLETLLKSPN